MGDAAYPVLPLLLPPYRRSTNWQPWMTTFNSAHTRQRVVVGGAFGLLKARFQHLQHVDVSSNAQAEHIVLAACVLHNLARRSADVLDEIEEMDSVADVLPADPLGSDEAAVLAPILRDSVAQGL